MGAGSMWTVLPFTLKFLGACFAVWSAVVLDAGELLGLDFVYYSVANSFEEWSKSQEVPAEEGISGLRRTLDDMLENEERSSRQVPFIRAKIEGSFQALPKNIHGNLGTKAARLLISTYVNTQYGWVLRGLEYHGMRRSTAKSLHTAAIVQDSAPLRRALLDNRERGMNLEEVSRFIAVIEHLFCQEFLPILVAAYGVRGWDPQEPLTEEQMQTVLEFFTVLLRGAGSEQGQFLVNVTLVEAKLEKDKAAQGSMNIKNLVSGVHQRVKPLLPEPNIFVPRPYNLDYVWRVAEELVYEYGSWQNRECQSIADVLASLDHRNTGRIHVGSFWSKTSEITYQFVESVRFLRAIGAVDDFKTPFPQVLVANYLVGSSNCVTTSRFASICCVNECMSILADVERKVQAPSATAEHLLPVLKSLAMERGGRPLDDAFRSRLYQAASQSGGLLPLHGRLFAQLLHLIFPRMCPYPTPSSVADTFEFVPLTGNVRWIYATERDIFLAKEKQMSTDSEPDLMDSWNDEELLPLEDETTITALRRDAFIRTWIPPVLRFVSQVVFLLLFVGLSILSLRDLIKGLIFAVFYGIPSTAVALKRQVAFFFVAATADSQRICRSLLRCVPWPVSQPQPSRMQAPEPLDVVARSPVGVSNKGKPAVAAAKGGRKAAKKPHRPHVSEDAARAAVCDSTQSREESKTVASPEMLIEASPSGPSQSRVSSSSAAAVAARPSARLEGKQPPHRQPTVAQHVAHESSAEGATVSKATAEMPKVVQDPPQRLPSAEVTASAAITMSAPSTSICDAGLSGVAPTRQQQPPQPKRSLIQNIHPVEQPTCHPQKQQPQQAGPKAQRWPLAQARQSIHSTSGSLDQPASAAPKLAQERRVPKTWADLVSVQEVPANPVVGRAEPPSEPPPPPPSVLVPPVVRAEEAFQPELVCLGPEGVSGPPPPEQTPEAPDQEGSAMFEKAICNPAEICSRPEFSRAVARRPDSAAPSEDVVPRPRFSQSLSDEEASQDFTFPMWGPVLPFGPPPGLEDAKPRPLTDTNWTSLDLAFPLHCADISSDMMSMEIPAAPSNEASTQFGV